MKPNHIVRSAGIGLIMTAAANAQSINIDLGTDTGIPPDTYAGVGIAGTWNGLSSDFAPNLVDIAGNVTNVSYSSFTAGFGPNSSTDTAGTADEPLMGDMAAHPFTPWDATLFNVEPGNYNIVVYSWGSIQLTETQVNPGKTAIVVSPVPGETITGAWPGELTEGVTHLKIEGYEHDGGNIVFSFTQAGVFGEDVSAICNGIQIEKLEPAGCPCDWNGVDDVDFFDLLDFLDDWFAGNADFNGVDGTDFFDLLDFLDCWFAASAGNCPTE